MGFYNSKLRLRHSYVAVLGALASFTSVSAQVLPGGPQVVAGQVTLTRQAASFLNIQNTPGTILNWQSYSIGAGSTVRYEQQNASSAVLNRVTGADPTSILGNLQSNGKVFLINPNGMIFGQGAKIDTAGFLASTLNITDSDFLLGKWNFEGAHKNGILNGGTVQSTGGGEIVLIAPAIENTGSLKTEGGSITLVAGQKVTLSNLRNLDIQIEIKAPDNTAVNLGTIASSGGAIGMFASSLKHSGDLNAISVVAGPGGTIVLQASDSVVLDAGSTIKADGFDTGSGGSVRVLSDQTAMINGQVTARGGANGGNGGFVETSAKQLLHVTAAPDASAPKGAAGEWLLDPFDITIVAGSGNTGISNTMPFTTIANASQLGADLITGALNNGTNVTVTDRKSTRLNSSH